MLFALILDWLGQVLIFVFILAMSDWTGVELSGDTLQVQGPWFLFVLLLYPLLGWLFGSYTVLRWRRLTFPLLLQRLLITGAVTLMVVAIARWLINPSEMVWLVHRRVQFLWMGSLSLWVLAVRVGLRRGLLLPDAPRFCCVQPWELDIVLADWRRLPRRQRLRPVCQRPRPRTRSVRGADLLALSQSARSDVALRPLSRVLNA